MPRAAFPGFPYSNLAIVVVYTALISRSGKSAPRRTRCLGFGPRRHGQPGRARGPASDGCEGRQATPFPFLAPARHPSAIRVADRVRAGHARRLRTGRRRGCEGQILSRPPLPPLSRSSPQDARRAESNGCIGRAGWAEARAGPYGPAIRGTGERCRRGGWGCGVRGRSIPRRVADTPLPLRDPLLDGGPKERRPGTHWCRRAASRRSRRGPGRARARRSPPRRPEADPSRTRRPFRRSVGASADASGTATGVQSGKCSLFAGSGPPSARRRSAGH